MGSIVNAIAIVLGGLIGLYVKKGFNQSMQDAMFKVIGIAIMFIGINGVLSNMVIIEGTTLKTSGEMILIISLVLGVLIGEILDIESKLNNCSTLIEKKLKLDGFASGFVMASLIFCVGAMAIIGAINDGLLHDPSVLYIKSIIDGITSIILASTLGIGVVFSSIPVFIYQGSITLLAGSLSQVLQGEFLRQICMVGYVLVFSIGLNFVISSKLKIANMLPSLIVVICINAILMLL